MITDDFYESGTKLSTLIIQYFCYSLTAPGEVGMRITILQRKKLRFIEVQYFAQGYAVIKQTRANLKACA